MTQDSDEDGPRDAQGSIAGWRPRRRRAVRRADKTGRDGKLDRKRNPKISPKDCGVDRFAWLPLALLKSHAWSTQSINTRKLIDFLQIEHHAHGGVANGELLAPYRQLEEYGLTHDAIRPAIEEAVYLGLLRFRQGGRYAGSHHPNLYRLTWLGGWDAKGQLLDPTNEWKGRTNAEIKAWKRDRKKQRNAKRNRKKQDAPRNNEAPPPQFSDV
ncbi:MAG: hypothetical protein AAGL49_13455 [Pseudomonadota bacterium]